MCTSGWMSDNWKRNARGCRCEHRRRPLRQHWQGGDVTELTVRTNRSGHQPWTAFVITSMASGVRGGVSEVSEV